MSAAAPAQQQATPNGLPNAAGQSAATAAAAAPAAAAAGAAAAAPVNATASSSSSSAVAAGGAAASYASASLYVGDLTADVTEALLFEIFNAVGPVASVRVCRDASTRRSLGYAYVNFHRVEDAERALDGKNFSPIRGRACRIMWSHRDPSLRKSGAGNIFVHHLARSIDNKQLFDTFSMFGTILSCIVKTNTKRESLGYGFVHFETEEAARNAIERVDGKVMAGEKVSVSMFKSKNERGGSNKYKYTNVFVKNLAGETTKEQLEQLFSEYGSITSSMVNQNKEDASKAFGFVNFAAPEQATAAVENANNREFNGRKLFVGRAQKKEERDKELRDRHEHMKLERQKKHAGMNLYVKNLSDDTDDEKLSIEFAKFGAISSVKVMRDGAGKSRGFGFVCFASVDDATKAVTSMNGYMLNSKPLYVAQAQRKETRRLQLEQQYAARAKIGVPQPLGPQMPYAAQNPMMFGGGLGPQQRQFGMYPAQVAGMRWNPQAGNPMMMGQPLRQPGMGYQLMPVNGGRGVPVQAPGVLVGQNQNQNQQRARGNQGRAGQQGVGGPIKMQQMPGQMPQQQQPIRYAENVRNVNKGAPNLMLTPQQQPAEMVMPLPNEPLTIKALAAAPEEMRKQMIGERLFPLIKLEQPRLAGKITGMLLEMDNGELIHLLESQPALHEKISEAMSVLEAHPETEQPNEENTTDDKQ